jgi:hypothetical protein
MKRVVATGIVGLVMGSGVSAALANAGAQSPPQKWLVGLGHRVSTTKFGTIKVYVTGDSNAQAADAHAIKALKAMGAPAPDQTTGTERVIVKPGATHKWLVTVSNGASTITVGAIGYPNASRADARAIKQLQNMGAAAPGAPTRTQRVIAEIWHLRR